MDSHDHTSLIRIGAKFLSCLCNKKHHQNIDFNLITEQTLPKFISLLNTNKDNEILVDSCRAISYLAEFTGSHDNYTEQIQKILDSGVCPRLVELIMHSTDRRLARWALRGVANLVIGDINQTQVILNSGILPVLFMLLDSPNESIRKETCSIISNIVGGGNNRQTQVYKF